MQQQDSYKKQKEKFHIKENIDLTNSRASSRVSPCEKICPNCESAYSCKPPDDDILK